MRLSYKLRRGRMKIPKKVAEWIFKGSVVGLFGTPPVAMYYFGNERVELLNNFPQYAEVKDLEEKLPQYEKDLLGCAPRSYFAPVSQDCVTSAVQYDALQSQLSTIKSDPEYIATLKKADTLEQHSLYVPLAGLLFAIPGLIGLFAHDRRKREENKEESQRSLQRLYDTYGGKE